MNQLDKAKFINSVKQLNKEELRQLFEKLQQEEAPLGMIMFVSKRFASIK